MSSRFPVRWRATDGPDRGARRGPHVVDDDAWDDAFKRNNICGRSPQHPDERQHRRPGGRDPVFYRDGKALAYLDRPDRSPSRRQNVAILAGPEGLHRGRPAGGGVLPPEADLRREFGSKEPFIFEDPTSTSSSSDVWRVPVPPEVAGGVRETRSSGPSDRTRRKSRTEPRGARQAGLRELAR